MEIDIVELQEKIGISEEYTEKIKDLLKNSEPVHSYLPMYNLLILEKWDEVVPLISKILDKSYDAEYISNLQKSKYYLQRQAVPAILRGISNNDDKVKSSLSLSLRDPIICVIKEAVETIKIKGIFSQDELLEIANGLFSNCFAKIKMLAVDILSMVKSENGLALEIARSSSWRVRAYLAINIEKFSNATKKAVAAELINDHIDEVRIYLSRHVHGLEFIDLLDDPCDEVRGNYLTNVLDEISDGNLLERLSKDKSWAVKKALLNLTGEWFKKITIPMIYANTENVKWRMKHDILSLIADKLENEFVARTLFGFIVEALTDRTCEIRNKAQSMVVRIIELYEWVTEHESSFEKIVYSGNYLHRMSILPVAIRYDEKYAREISRRLFFDPVKNVREFYQNYVRENHVQFAEDSGSIVVSSSVSLDSE
ncbi:serine/threonine-protein phosphatase 2A regulatory subunit A [Enteropsectra breve]|nr:serine/threonine-protein phosphatase 2A regulatory subunit A [Enteropsectra breve]